MTDSKIRGGGGLAHINKKNVTGGGGVLFGIHKNAKA